MTVPPLDDLSAMLLADMNTWPKLDSPELLPEALRRAAVYQLLALAHMAPSGSAQAARYAMLARTACYCTDSRIWLRSDGESLPDLLRPVMSEHEQAAFDALGEAIQEIKTADGMRASFHTHLGRPQ